MIKFTSKLQWLNRLALILFGFLAFFVLSYFSAQVPAEIFNSPDEAANYWFSSEVVKTDLPVFYDGRNLKSEGLVGMRSTRAIGEKTVPGSFLGLSLTFGWLGKIIGSENLPFITPAFLALALVAFWDIIWRTTKNKFIAWLVSFLALLAPPTLYFGSHGFFHNGAFVATLILALWAVILTYQKKQWFYFLFFGLMTSLALFFRTNEIVWLAPVFFVVYLSLILDFRKKTKPAVDEKRSSKNRRELLAFYILPWLGLFLPLAWLFATNFQLYGSIFSFGNYLPDFSTIISSQPLSLIQRLLIPFGLHPSIIKEVFIDYFIILLWPLSLLLWWGVVGSLVYWPRLNRFWRGGFIIYLLVSAWLIILYGSWEFFDHPVLKVQTLGTSYVRYFWPIWIFGLIFLAKVMSLWTEREVKFIHLKRSAAAWLIVCLVVVFYLPWALLTAYTSEPDGLLTSLPVYTQNQAIKDKILATTERDSIILAHSMDKVLWPRRQVIYNLPTPQTKKIVVKMLNQGLKIYELQLTYGERLWSGLNRSDYAPAGFVLSQPLWTEQGWSLYQLKLIE